MLCARWLRREHEQKHGRVYLALEGAFDGVRDAYGRTLARTLDKPGLMLAVALLTLVATVFMFRIVKTGFIPTQDTGSIFASTQAPDGTSFEQMVELQRKAVKKIEANPGVDAVMSSVGQGQGGVSSSNGGRLNIRLKPSSERDRSADEVIGELRKAVAEVPLLEVIFSNPPAIRIGRVGSGNYQYVLQGSSLDVLKPATAQMLEKMRGIRGIRDVNSDLQLANPQIDVGVRRDRAAALGVSVADVQSTLYAAYGASRISTIFSSTNSTTCSCRSIPATSRTSTRSTRSTCRRSTAP